MHHSDKKKKKSYAPKVNLEIVDYLKATSCGGCFKRQSCRTVKFLPQVSQVGRIK
jgi:hypothetical protein